MKNIRSETKDFSQELVKKHPPEFKEGSIPEFYWSSVEDGFSYELEFQIVGVNIDFVRVNDIPNLNLENRLQFSYNLDQLVLKKWRDLEQGKNVNIVINGINVIVRAYRIINK